MVIIISPGHPSLKGPLTLVFFQGSSPLSPWSSSSHLVIRPSRAPSHWYSSKAHHHYHHGHQNLTWSSVPQGPPHIGILPRLITIITMVIRISPGHPSLKGPLTLVFFQGSSPLSPWS